MKPSIKNPFVKISRFSDNSDSSSVMLTVTFSVCPDTTVMLSGASISAVSRFVVSTTFLPLIVL